MSKAKKKKKKMDVLIRSVSREGEKKKKKKEVHSSKFYQKEGRGSFAPKLVCRSVRTRPWVAISKEDL